MVPEPSEQSIILELFMMYTYKHPRPSITVDVVAFTIKNDHLSVLLVKRAKHPFRGSWALPGGFININEDLETAAMREFVEETSIKGAYLEQLHTYGNPDRDPRGRVVSIAYIALLPYEKPCGKSDATLAEWYPINHLPELAFDHADIIRDGIRRLRNRLDMSAVGFQLLPKEFDIFQIKHIYEIILDKRIDSDILRQQLLKIGLIEKVIQTKTTNSDQASLYSFKDAAIEQVKEG